ncbi:hypothetical protein DSUL_20089 [Desulfovibrionales bacterium]
MVWAMSTYSLDNLGAAIFKDEIVWCGVELDMVFNLIISSTLRGATACLLGSGYFYRKNILSMSYHKRTVGQHNSSDFDATRLLPSCIAVLVPSRFPSRCVDGFSINSVW